jgi:aerobic carbon-monoxide dehydrogenase medium subunit
MIPPAFEYVRPSSVDEAVAALAAGDEAKVLAGGQSLLPLLRLRLSFPSVLVDLGRLNELRGVREEAGELVVGAMTTHAEVASSDLVRSRCGLLAAAAATIGDPAVRHRGTFGGSLAHADPAGDLPAIAVALDATLVAAGPSGRRSIPARDFFADYLSTALQPDEVLVEVRVPVLGEGWGYRYEKFRRVVQAWTIVGVAAAVRRSDGQIAEARIGLANMGSTPVRAAAVEQALAGVAVSDSAAIGRAADQAAVGASAPSDLHAKSDYREHLARALTRRAVTAAAGPAA